MSELLLQKLWHRKDFAQEQLCTEDGRSLKVINQGTWNRQEGPDFLNAELELGGQRLTGDVEIHFHARDWQAHGHGLDPRFARVVLHVVLFPPAENSKSADLSTAPLLVLLPHLLHDLEDYASMEQLGALDEARDRAVQWLQYTLAERRVHLRQYAHKRWQQKYNYAWDRLRRDGWEQACHTLFLEALGYRRNRAPMANLALQNSPAKMRSDLVNAESEEALATRYFGEVHGWKLAGLRPANHPRKRLAEYLRLVRQKPDWAVQVRAYLLETAARLPINTPATAAYRKLGGLTPMRKAMASSLASIWNGPKLDTLIVDVLLPLLATQDEKHYNALETLWYHWFAGDAPESWRLFLDSCQLLSDRAHPVSNGAYQGAFQALLEG